MAVQPRLLTFSTLYPNSGQPNHGIFVETRLRHLVASGAVSATVVAPVPYFPSAARVFGDWARYARVPPVEQRHGLTVHHPRYPLIPRVGMSLAPMLMYRGTVARVARLAAAADIIDAHYLYPDGVAAARIAARVGKPVVLTARGSDVTQLANFARPRAAIIAAIARADWLITVSASLRDGLLALGADPARVTVLRNGVDTGLFAPVDRAASRATLGLTRKTLLSVGLLIERKRHHLAIAAMPFLPDCELLIVGEGPEHAALGAMIDRLGLRARVRLLGPCPHADLPRMYGAADALILASSREGWANVLLESMACGTPVVAMRIGGNPEVVRDRAAGVIVDDATPEALAAAIRDLLATPPARSATRAYAEQFGWGETTAGQIAIFHEVLERRRHGFVGPLAAA
jgi:glycosyltransferase involved in cell wall biosynthesis